MRGKNGTRKLVERFQGEASKLRETLIEKNVRSVEMKLKKWGSEEPEKKKMSEDKAVEKYKELSVFTGEYSGMIEDEVFTNIVGDIDLTDDEKKVLANSPKVAILNQVNNEEVERELEITGMKTRWDYRSNPGEYEREEETISEIAQELETKTRQVFNFDEKVIDFSNSHVHLPKAAPLKFETQLQMRK